MAVTSRAEVHLRAVSEPAPERPAPRTDRPFHLGVLADFAARESRGGPSPEVSGRAPVPVDRDDLDRAMERMAPRLRLDVPLLGGLLELRPTGMEDLHADALLRHPALERGGRGSGAEGRAGDAAPPAAAAALPEDGPDREPSPVDGAGVLDRILEATGEDRPRRSDPGALPDPGDLQAFVEEAVAPDVVREPAAAEARAEALREESRTEALRVLLRHPDWLAFEARWRAVELLVRRIETGPRLKIHLVDVSAAEVRADLQAPGDVSASALGRLLGPGAPGTSGAEPWGLLVVDATIGDGEPELRLAEGLAGLGRHLGAPVLAGASPSLAGWTSLAAMGDAVPAADPPSRWRALRAHPDARYLGLVLPRVLLRVPYSPRDHPLDALDFEEMPGGDDHGSYVWGNGAFLAALVLARAFARAGWDLRAGLEPEVEGLPLHLYRRAGETRAKPCAEALLPDRAVERFLECGLMPLSSRRGRDAVRLVRVQSVTDPPSFLAGAWNGGGR